jgi:hypothetical protein
VRGVRAHPAADLDARTDRSVCTMATNTGDDG